jgi:tRNA/tmRNA/rRNA uracil-C5-methylase (TrmA/RlmC/RlmD family)
MDVLVGPVAHGGHCVARPPDGPLLFVRHALPGERVRVEVTERRSGFWRADAVEVLEASPDRVAPPCPFARPGLCGGCDFQHASLPAQRALKASVVREQLARLGGRPDLPVEVEALDPALEWRTRVQYAVDSDGRLGFHRFRSHEVVPVDRCAIAAPAAMPVLARRWSPALASVEVVASSGGDVAVLTRRSRTGRARVIEGPAVVREVAAGRGFAVDADAFWQVHPAAPTVLAGAVVELLAPRAGERAWDLYAGAGLFAAALAPLVDRVTAVEADPRGVAAARRSLADLPNLHLVHGNVQRVLAGDLRGPQDEASRAGDLRGPRGEASRAGDLRGPRAEASRAGLVAEALRWVDVVVLDPPRSGAGRAVVEAIAARRPRAVAYVACDPAAFARDVATFAELGYHLTRVRGFDAFPMTHHVECIGLFEAA